MKYIGIFNRIKAFYNEINSNYNTAEKVFFPLVIIVITILSYITNDNKIALLCAICGISYTIFNGKGIIYCYLFSMIGTICYAYLSFKNGLWANFSLNLFYYFPLEIIGLFAWKKHLVNKLTVKKTKLNSKNALILHTVSVIAVCLIGLIFKKYNIPIINFLDFLVLVLSIIAMILAVKRCAEQWYYWTIVNFLSVIIWIIAYLNGSNCLATIIMWLIYLFCGIYFIRQWEKEL